MDGCAGVEDAFETSSEKQVVLTASIRHSSSATGLASAPAGAPSHDGDMYVYLTSGDVLAVPSISDLELSDQSIRLRDCNGVTVEYPRSAVYFMSRVLDAPPSMF